MVRTYKLGLGALAVSMLGCAVDAGTESAPGVHPDDVKPSDGAELELDPDVFGSEIGAPPYERVERIAAVGMVVRLLGESRAFGG